jgi:hypothetical protein
MILRWQAMHNLAQRTSPVSCISWAGSTSDAQVLQEHALLHVHAVCWPYQQDFRNLHA